MNENIAKNECIPISARDITTHDCRTTSQNTDTQHKESKLEVFKPLVLEVRKSLLQYTFAKREFRIVFPKNNA